MSMIKRSADRPEKELQLVGGPGMARVRKIIESDEELFGKGRLFNDFYLDKGCGVGYHTHCGDAEIYYVLSGEGEYNDNGTVTTIKAGDVTFTHDGESHGLINNGDEPLHVIALIIYERLNQK